MSPSTAKPSAKPAPVEAAAAEDLRLAILHLRLGQPASARAELEDLERRGALGLAGLAALAEARWRTGDIERAATAAERHLEGGGDDQLAIIVAAEAAAAAGLGDEAHALVARLGLADPQAVDALFAGMPRRATWPAATAAPGPPSGGDAPGRASPPPDLGTVPPRSAARSGDVQAGGGLWDTTGDDAPAGATAARPPARAAAAWVGPARARGHADPDAEVETARDELVEAPDRGLLRLALALRLDPTLAPDVLEAVRLRREPAAAVLRGDAQRLLGRHLEAEAAYADAVESIEREALATTHRGASPAASHDQEDT